MIMVRNVIDTAFSLEDAEKLTHVIDREISNKDEKQKVIIDFDGIRYFTTLFFNNAIIKYIGELGSKEFTSLFEIRNLSEVGKTTYAHSLQNGKEYYSLNDEERKMFDDVLNQYIDDND